MKIEERWTEPEDREFPLLGSDWEYSDFPDSSLRIQSCFLYEYARSSAKCVEEVEALRDAGIILPTTIPGLVGDSRKESVSLVEYSRAHDLPMKDFERIKLLTFVGRFEGFPDKPWHLQPDQVEDSLVDLGSERLPWLGRGGEPEWTTNPSAMVSEMARLEDRLDLWIDWRLSDEKITEGLRDQLKESRPPEFPEPDGQQSNYCIYAGTNFPFRFQSALEWLSVRRKAGSLKHVPRSDDFWNSYLLKFEGAAHVSESNARKRRQHVAHTQAVIDWFSFGGLLIDAGRKGRIQWVKEGNRG